MSEARRDERAKVRFLKLKCVHFKGSGSSSRPENTSYFQYSSKTRACDRWNQLSKSTRCCRPVSG